MNIAKLDAAKRQLDTAINLFFKEADSVSMHTLTAAAHQILMDLAKLKGAMSFIKTPTLIKKEMQKKYLYVINEAENFFKHAAKDSDKLLEFNPEQTEFLLLDAVEMYTQLTKEAPEDMSIYRMWFFIKHPEIISDETRKGIEAKNLSIQKYRAMHKLKFYTKMKDSFMYRAENKVFKSYSGILFYDYL